MAESRSVVVRLSLDTAQAMRASKEFGAEVDRAMTQAEKRTSSARGAMDQLGGSSGKMALAAAAGLTAIVATTANFDEAMSHVAATGDDARSSIDELREAAIQAGQDTAFSASEAAGGIENLAKAGVSAKDILGGGLSGALDLAAAGGLEVSDAAEVAATALTQFKLSGEDVPHVADLLAAAAGKAQGDVSDMSFALKQSGLVASQMGISIEETTGTLGAFASAGLLGSDAGTSFRTMLLRLANPTTESANLMEQLGLQAYDAQGKFVGMASVAGQLQSALQSKTQAERDSALATIFGSDAIRAASVLYEQGTSGIQQWTDKVDDAGYAAETAATRMDNLKGDVEQFLGSLETALIGAGDGSQGALRGLVQNATDVVNVFNDAPPAIQGTVTKLLALAAVTGGAAWFGSKVIRGISDTRQALSELGVTADSTAGRLAKIGGTALGMVAVGTAVGAIADQIGRIDAENLDRAMTALSRGEVTDTIDGVVKSLSTLEGIGDPLAGVGDSIAETVTLFGLFGDTTLDKAANNVDQLDQKLAQLVETGNEAAASDLFNRITDLAEKQGVTAEETAKNFDAYALALRNANDETSPFMSTVSDLVMGMAGVTSGSQEASAATTDLETAQRQAAAQAKAMKDALDAEREAAHGTAESFLDFGDSLDDGKKSLGSWIHSLQEQADALHNFRVNAQTAADKGLRQGLIEALEEAGPAGALRMRQLANATDAEIKRANRAWQSGRDEMKKYVDFKVPDKRVDIDINPALKNIHVIQAQLAEMNGDHVTTYIDVVRRSFDSKRDNIPLPGEPRANGGPIYGPGSKTSDSVPIMASRGEFMMSAAAVDHYGLDTMFAMNARRLAGGGSVDGTTRSLDSRLEILGVLQQIRDLRHDLASTKKGDRLTGLDRQIARLQLEAAERDLRRAKHAEEREAAAKARDREQAQIEKNRQKLADLSALNATRGSLFDSLLPQDPQTVQQGVVAAIADFKTEWLAAGGVWTKAMRDWANQATSAAAEYDTVTAALDAETKKRDALTASFDELQATMKSYNATVAGNFLRDPFKGARTESIEGVDDGPAARALKAAQDELAALRGSSAGDSIGLAARAAELIAQIKVLQANADTEADGSSREISGLEALRQTLEEDTANADALSGALQQLAARGLDTTGDLGGLYQQLAASGDFATAQQLAALSASQIDEYEKLFKAREDAAALVAAQATSAVYGDQAAQLQTAIDNSTAAIELLAAQQTVVADQVRTSAETTTAALGTHLNTLSWISQGISTGVQDLPRRFAEERKKARA